MQANKTQYGRALAIIPSDTVPIPNIATEVVRTETTEEAPFRLICDTVDFVELNVNQMAILYNLTSLTSTTIISVMDENTLILTDNIMEIGDKFVIYNEADIAGCALYIPVKEAPGRVTVKTVGGDIVTFYRLSLGDTILPVNVSMVRTGVVGLQSGEQILGLW
jgi:hypothetical protein